MGRSHKKWSKGRELHLFTTRFSKDCTWGVGYQFLDHIRVEKAKQRPCGIHTWDILGRAAAREHQGEETPA